mgnify:CR=1 FL=1
MKFFNVAVIFILGLFSQICFANEISFAKYAHARCQDYTGTWEGFITDPHDLFANGGPWPVTVMLFHKNGYLIGHVSKVKISAKNSIGSKQIWATCKDGVLDNIFWGNRGDCGSLSKEGLQISKNSLALKLHWENAMANTDFLVFLKKKNQRYPYALPKKLHEYNVQDIKSCH